MLVLRRKDGQWVTITHKSGDVMRVRLCDVKAGEVPQASLVFDDPDRLFEVRRVETVAKGWIDS